MFGICQTFNNFFNISYNNEVRRFSVFTLFAVSCVLLVTYISVCVVSKEVLLHSLKPLRDGFIVGVLFIDPVEFSKTSTLLLSPLLRV